MNAKTFFFNNMNSLSGIFYENYVSTELSAKGYNLFYWKGENYYLDNLIESFN